MRHPRLPIWTTLLAFFVLTLPAQAADIPFATRQASVIVQCGDKQGSGVVINGTEGYVLTNAHVLLNETTNQPDPCELGFISDQSYEPNVFYRAQGVQYVYDAANNRDFAILKIGRRIQGNPLTSFPFLETDEFSEVGDPLTLITYPAEANGDQYVSTGTISLFDQGTIRTDAFIGHGSSGGPGVDAQNNLIGIARGIIYPSGDTDESGTPVGYELVDIRDVITWMDTLPEGSNAYITHADAARYNAPQTYTTPVATSTASVPPPQTLNCQLLAKSQDTSTVYCLKSDGTRAVFPNDATYVSWFSDFSAVQTVSDQDLANYQLSSNITLKTGTLVKIESDPKVYLVTDAQGTLRWIPSETTASTLFGAGWAGFVKDIPVTFFPDYHIGEPLPE
ncbi:MAG: serine protease [Patescibacteria group bacterium]